MAAAGLALLTSTARAETREDGDLWINFSFNGNLGGGWQGQFELHPRFQDDGKRFLQFLTRVAAGHEVARGMTLWGGYAHTEFAATAGHNPNEERVYEPGELRLRQARRGFDHVAYAPGGKVAVERAGYGLADPAAGAVYYPA
jgi:hypothetical protein